MKLEFRIGDTPISLFAERDDDGWQVSLPDGTRHRIGVTRRDDDILQIVEALEPPALTRTLNVSFARLDNDVHLSYGGRTFRFQPRDARVARTTPARSSGVLTAPMSGIIVDLHVAVGDRVEAYQPLAVIEAMKIMSTLEAPFAGTVKAVHYRIKQQAPHGAPVIEIAPEIGGEQK